MPDPNGPIPMNPPDNTPTTVGPDVAPSDTDSIPGAHAVLPEPSTPEPSQYWVPSDIKDEIANRFTYHAPSANQIVRYQMLRSQAQSLALLILHMTPSSREQSIALTRLQEVVMWANAAIACNELATPALGPAESPASPPPGGWPQPEPPKT